MNIKKFFVFLVILGISLGLQAEDENIKNRGSKPEK